MLDGEVVVIQRKANPPPVDGERTLPGSTENGLAGRVTKHVENQGAVSTVVAGILVVDSVCSHNLILGVVKGGEPFGKRV